MVKDKKKNFTPHKGNPVKQSGDFKFVDDFNTWRKNCQSVSGADMKVEHIENLYVFLKNHMKGNIRSGSRNDGQDGRGATQFLSVIETFIDNDLFTMQNAEIVKSMADTLEDMKDTGKVAGERTPAFDPAFIVFTEQDYTDTGEKKPPRTVQGHYRTEWYQKKNGGELADPEWLAGKNPPHQALFSEESGPYSRPKGLLAIMKEATDALDDVELEVEVNRLSGAAANIDLDEIKSVEDFFNGVIKNTAYWSNGGKLLVNKVRAELQGTDFAVNPGNKEQRRIRQITNVGLEEQRDALVGTLISFKLTATATPIIDLVDRALKRANKTTSPVKHPDGGYFKAWQNSRKGGFDYRRTRREVFGDDTRSPDNKVIGKMWQQILWRR